MMFRLGLSHRGTTGSPNPQCGYFPVLERLIGRDILKNCQNTYIGFLAHELGKVTVRRTKEKTSRIAFIYTNSKPMEMPHSCIEVSRLVPP